MHIERKSIYDLPEDAIIMDKKEVLDFYRKQISDWKNRSESWPIIWAPGILGAAGVVTATLISSYLRIRLRVPETGKIPFFFLTGGSCGAFSIAMHFQFAQPSILLQDDCSNCVYLKALGLHLGSVFVYGIAGSAMIVSYTAHRSGSYPIPGFESWKECMETYEMFKRFAKRYVPTLSALIVFNTALVVLMVNRQFNAFNIIRRKLQERDERLRSFAQSYTPSPNKNVT